MLPQPQYWLLSSRSIASVVGSTQPGYQWKAAANIGSNVSGALPSGMPDQEVGPELDLPSCLTETRGLFSQCLDAAMKAPDQDSAYHMCRSGLCCLYQRQ